MKKDKNVLRFKVPDMTCQHCKMTVTNALKSFPEVKSVSVDLNSKEVLVETDMDKEKI